MQISSGWLARIADKVRAVFRRNDGVADTVAAAPSPTEPLYAVPIDSPVDGPAIEAPAAPRQFPRMLAARIACQNKLNVPVGKKPRVAPLVSAKTATRRPKHAAPKHTTTFKTTPKARSVYLPARHLAAKSQPKPRSNVVLLPIAAKATKTPRATVSKQQRLAA